MAGNGTTGKKPAAGRVRPMTPGEGATRTGTQVGFPGAVVVMLGSFGVIDWTMEQTVAVLTVTALATAFVQRLVEDRIGRGFLREVPADNKPRRRRRAAKPAE